MVSVASQVESGPGGSAASPSSSGPSVPVARRALQSIGGHARGMSGLAILAILIVSFSLALPGTFPTSDTFKNITGQQAITVVLAIGILFSLAAGQYDLSAAQNLGFSAIVAASLMSRSHVAPGLAVILTVLLGAGVGALNGILVAVVGINSFIATLGMSSVLLAATEKISNDQFVGPVSSNFQGIVGHQPIGIPIIFLYAMVLAIVAWYVLEHTPVGRRVYATGANAEASRLVGVRTGRYIFWSFVATGAMAALAGVLATAQIGEVTPTEGPSYLLPAFAACFLGTTQFKVGRFNVWGTVVALYLLATGVTGLQLAGAQLWVTDLFDGVALIGAVGVAVVAQRRRTRQSTSAG